MHEPLAQDSPACLLVDDREENLFAHEALLRDTGARISKARCADEALELLLHDEFDLALIDVQMPGMDGIELAEAMRGIERTRSVPIIFVTATPHDEARLLRGYGSGGAVDFLYKPITPHVMRSKVGVFLELARNRKRVRAELARTERALADADAARTALMEANELRDRLVAIVSHDLRTPLAVIDLAAQLLGSRELAPRDAEAVSRISRASDRMTHMIEELLDFSRAHQGGGFPVEPVLGDLVDVCHAVVAELRVVHADRAIELRAAEPIEGMWDSRALSQACSNVLGNALQHGDASPVTMTVSRDGDDATVEVHNDGEPIPTELLAELFAPYRRGPTRSSRGLGLGLYITSEIVRAHGGDIEVRSTRADGTRFTLRVPVRRSAAAG